MKVVLLIAVAIATYIDLKRHQIPNWITYPALTFALLYFDHFYIFAILIAFIAALIFGKFIGAGDIKMALVLAIWSHILNWSQYWLYVALILGGIFGLIYRAKRLPFAPFMAAGLLIANLAQGRAII
jgi:prepilin signal peptidase PulO-like enzyme (type II secretory pathway)